MCLSALRRNEIVALKPDVVSRKNVHAGDLELTFLNGPETFRPGGALMAKLADAPLIPIWIHLPMDQLPGRCVIGPPLYVQGDVRTAVQAQAALMEAEVRNDPACWSAWLNPRRGSSLELG